MRRWSLTLLLCGLPWLCAAQTAPAAVQTITLKNGLRVLLAPDSLAAGVDVAVWYAAGTRYERAGTRGATRTLARLMFDGSERYAPGAHQRLLAAEGAAGNTITAHDATCFFETVPTEALELALGLEADRMGALKPTAEGFERARRSERAEERRRDADNPMAQGLRVLYATAFAGHPYEMPALGRARDLDRLTAEACRAYYRERYGPNNAVLTVVGRFDPDEALRLVRRTFDPLPRRPVPPAAPPVLAAQTAERRARDRTTAPVRFLLVGWRAPGRADSSSVALELLSRVVSSGSRGRLQRALSRGATLCLAVTGGFDGRRDASLLYAAAALRPSADSAEVERAMIGELQKLAATPVDAVELDHAKRELELSTLAEWETPRGRAQALGEAEAVYGGWRDVEARLARLRQTTPDDLMRAAAAVLVPARRTVVWLLPGASPRAGVPEARKEGVR
jgi:zinc protease